MKVKEPIKRTEADGWVQTRQRRSRRQFRHPTRPGTVSVSGKPNIDVPPGTLNNALKQAGLEKQEMIMRFMAIVEERSTSRGACVPDLPGCMAAGEAREEALQLIREAIEFHLEGLTEKGEPVPEPHSYGEVVDVHAA